MKNFFRQINDVQDILPIIDSLFSDDERKNVHFAAQKQLLFALFNYVFCVALYNEQHLFTIVELLQSMKGYNEKEKSDTDLLFASLANQKNAENASYIVLAYTNAKALAGKDLLIVVDKCLKMFFPIKGASVLTPLTGDEIIPLADAIIENFGRPFEQDVLPIEIERDFIISIVAFVYYTGNEYNTSFLKKLDDFYTRLQDKNPFYDYYKKFNDAKKIDNAKKFIFKQYFNYFYDIDDIDSGLFQKIVGETKKILLDIAV